MNEDLVPETGIKPKGFFASLFDSSFTSFITPTVYSVGYGMAVVLILFTGSLVFVMSIVQGRPLFVAIAPIATLFGLILTRMTAESVVLFFRIGENIKLLADLEMVEDDEEPTN
jgi:Domain of unknown function (DUF4282)